MFDEQHAPPSQITLSGGIKTHTSCAFSGTLHPSRLFSLPIPRSALFSFCAYALWLMIVLVCVGFYLYKLVKPLETLSKCGSNNPLSIFS